MILKTLSLSVATALALSAASPSPLSIGSRSTDTGGTKSAIDAYSDGGGVLLINQTSDTKIDNSAMNKLVFKYGDAAKKNGVLLGSEVKTISITSTPQEKILADKLNTTNLSFSAIPNGTLCNDYSAQTINDKFINGMCEGKLFSAPTCADIAMAYNTTTNLCSKGGISTYAATQTNNYSCPTGGTLSGTTCTINQNYNATSQCGFHNSGGQYTSITSGASGASDCSGIQVMDNTCSSQIRNLAYCPTCIQTVNPGGYYSQSANGGCVWNIYNDGVLSRSCPSGGTLSGAICLKSTAYTATNAISTTCPSGGTLSGTTCTINTLVTAGGICQTGYALISNQCVQN